MGCGIWRRRRRRNPVTSPCKGYVPGVKSDHHFSSWSGKPPVAGIAQETARDLDPSAWQHLSVGEGIKGAWLHDWAYCELVDLDADEYSETRTGLWTRGLLNRRNISDGDLAFFTTWCPAGTSIQTLVSVEGHRWAIEDSFEIAKNELGLDHNGTRSQRDPIMAWLALPRLSRRARLRHDGGDPVTRQRRDAPKKTEDADHQDLIRWSIQEVRGIATRLAQRRIKPEYIIAWSYWRRAHQAAARRAHLKSKMQL
ncbi:Ribonuclease H-like domain containing protein [Parasponia andersonii]|uniref:Ribonuclease H-like domain containing protein n=1 Tax=Parasponia andersonii TaxID=3476 RepID=A0A2P5CDU3_PARAD|nr:Ribonuclease H-like domain containing protein [Parasponia andersonii]